MDETLSEMVQKVVEQRDRYETVAREIIATLRLPANRGSTLAELQDYVTRWESRLNGSPTRSPVLKLVP